MLRYEVGQKYNSHYDTFNPKEYGPQSSQRVSEGSWEQSGCYVILVMWSVYVCMCVCVCADRIVFVVLE